MPALGCKTRLLLPKMDWLLHLSAFLQLEAPQWLASPTELSPDPRH